MDKIGTRIYQTNYVRAADLQALIQPLLTPNGIGTCTVTPASETGIAVDNNKAGGDTFAGGDSLLVRDYEAVLAQVDQVVAQIDKRPMQVAIEAMILSVKLDDSTHSALTSLPSATNCTSSYSVERRATRCRALLPATAE